MKKLVYFLLLTPLFLFQCKKAAPTLYTLLDQSCGISFSNDISLADSLVLPGYEYIYNGGGVGIIDVNNDGLQDIYFTGNLVSSKLYLNKGQLRFEDITSFAGVGTNTWANGVAIVDINQDGFKDFYVSVGGHQYTPDSLRHNLLFINNKDNTFIESAKEYGLDDNGYGIQAAFLDYDRDGDLDMYLLRNSFVDYPRNNARPKQIRGEAASNDKLFRNNGNHTFTDVSKEAGITIAGFGLGLAIADINEDGWPDIYVSNDFITNDLLWINNQDGTFTNQIATYLKHQTFNGMGVDIADYNNDGLVDIVELDMLPPDNKRWKLTPRGNSYDEFQNGISKGYEPQYVRNTLQLNNGNGSFSEIGQLAGIEATDWSWSALFIDMDHDGLKDLYITNGYGKDITNLDFIVYGGKSELFGMTEASVKEKQKLLNQIPGVHIHNYAYKNYGHLAFQDKTSSWMGLTPTFSNGSAYADLDLDGDLEIITNNIDERASIWKSNLIQVENGSAHYLRAELTGPPNNNEGIGAKVIIWNNDQQQMLVNNPYRGYLSTMESTLHFGIGKYEKVDSLQIQWPDGNIQWMYNVSGNQKIKLDYNKSLKPISKKETKTLKLFSDITDTFDLNFKHSENIFTDFKVQPLLPLMHSRLGPGIAAGDINGDKLEDFYIGNASHQNGNLFIQTNSKTFIQQIISTTPNKSDEMGILMIDIDQDSDLDLYSVHGGSEQRMTSTYYQDILYINDGTGTMQESENILPTINQSGSCIVACDFDHDNDLDLFRGSRLTPGAYPIGPKSYLFINKKIEGGTKFKNLEAPFLENLGMVSSALWTDFDNDGWEDLIIVGEFMPITFIKNEKGKLTNITSSTGLESSNGWWNSISSGDFDNDGDMDYIAGNIGLNTRFKASKDEPMCIYAKDYNQDGTLDPIISQYRQGVKYVNHTRDNLISQINSMRNRFRTYASFANATFENTLTAEETNSALVVQAMKLESTYIQNHGKGKFSFHDLPIQTQFAPVYGISIDDWDVDGELDALLTGNLYSLEVINGRADAHNGLLLKGDGKGKFTSISTAQSGFYADKDAKGMARIIVGNNNNGILVANNDDTLQLFMHNINVKLAKIPNQAKYAVATLVTGQKRKYEFYQASTYLSSSSSQINFTDNIQNITVYLSDGKSIVIKPTH